MEEINFIPMNGHVAVYSPIVEETTKSGIIKSEEMKKAEEKADLFLEVFSVSDDVTTIKPGDLICVNPKACLGIPVDGHQILIVHENTILGKRKNK